MAPGHAFRAWRQHQGCAERGKHAPTLKAHGLGHGERQLVAARGGHEGQRDAGIAAGGLDDLLAVAEHTSLFGVLDHGSADAALDRVGRVATLDLGQHGGLGSRGDAVELDERRAADGQGVVSKDGGHGSISFQRRREPPPRGDYPPGGACGRSLQKSCDQRRRGRRMPPPSREDPAR
jgi:hypothetical protein